MIWICAAVIVLVQAGVVILRWTVETLQKRGHEIFAFLAGILITAAVLTLKLPVLRDPLMESLKPLFAGLNFAMLVYLLEFVVVTTLIRMFFEHVVLHLRYSKGEWLLFGLLFVYFTFWTFRMMIPN